MIRNADVLGILKYFCLLAWLRPVAELELSWKTLNTVLNLHLSNNILENGGRCGHKSRLVYSAPRTVPDRSPFGKIRGRSHHLSKHEKTLFFQDDPKCSNYWLFPLVGDTANKHAEFSEPTSTQLLSLTCGQNKNWSRIYPDKCKGFCLK